MNKYIIFGDENYNSLGVVRTLGENNINPVCIFIKSKYKLASKSKYAKQRIFVENKEEGYQYIVSKYASEPSPVILIFTDDTITSYFDQRYNEINGKFIFYNAGSAGRVSKYMDKETIMVEAQKCGMNVAKTYKVTKGAVPAGLKYPIMTKAVDSIVPGWKDNAFICNTQEELEEAYTKMNCEEILLQEYIHKKNELCIDGFSVNKGKDIFLSIASNYKYILPDSFSTYMNIWKFNDEPLRKKINVLMEKIRFEGIFCIEFLIDEKNEMYFLEVNFRNSGWSYASTCAGYPLPIMWGESMVSKKISAEYDEYPLIPEGFSAMVEISDLRIRLKRHMISLPQWYKEYREADCHYYKGKSDIRPLLSEVWSIFKRKVLRSR